MAAVGYSIAVIEAIPLTGKVDNLVEGLQGITLQQPSRVRVWLSREDVLVLAGVNIGGVQVLQTGSPTPIDATVGAMPKIQDDLMVEVFADRNDLILVSATNTNAADKELRALIQVLPLDDVLLSTAINMRRSA